MKSRFPSFFSRSPLWKWGSVLSALVLVALLGYGAMQFVSAVSPHMTAEDLTLSPQVLNAPITGTLPDSQPMHVAVTFVINQQTLQQMKHVDHQVAANNNLAGALGISSGDYQRMQHFFQGPGIKLTLSKSRTRMTIDAPVGTLAKLLQTRFVTHKLNGQTYFTPDPQKMPQLPADIAAKILAINGLDNYGPPVQQSFNYDSATAKKSAHALSSCTFPSGVITPAQMAHAYGADTLWSQGFTGSGNTINLVEIGSFDPSDTQAYFNCVGYKGTLDVINVHESTMPALGETTLDIELAAAMAPNITIKDYQSYRTGNGNGTAGSWLDIDDALNRIIDDNTGTAHGGDVVSVSMIGNEAGFPANVRDAINQSIAELTNGLGMTVYISSGDCGAYMSGNSSDVEVSFPASSPYAVAVGGTQLYTDSTGNRTNEVSWSGPLQSGPKACNANTWGSTGGVSKVYARPSWQQGWFGIQSPAFSNSMRQTPDISAIATNTAFLINGTNGWAYGTSISAPVVAVGMVLVNEKLASAHLALPAAGPAQFYTMNTAQARVNAAYFDVVVGDNHYYPATSGYDMVTGLGAINLTGIYATMASPQPKAGNLLQLQGSTGYTYLYGGNGWRSWTNIASGTNIAALVANGNYIYMLYKNGEVLTYTGGTYNAWHFLDDSATAIAITADSSGHLYELRKGGQIWQYGGKGLDNWIELDDNTATTAISASGNGVLYQERSNGQLLKYTGGGLHSWTQVDKSAYTKTIMASGASLYQLHTSGNIYQLTSSGSWTCIDCSAKVTAITADASKLYELRSDGTVWRHASGSSWTKLDTNTKIKSITANGNLYELRSDGSIWAYSGTGTTWTELDANAATTKLSGTYAHV